MTFAEPSSEAQVPFEHIDVVPEDPCAPAELRPMLAVDTLHDGNFVPPEFRRLPAVEALERSGEFHAAYALERDWGANRVARRIASRLGLSSYFQVNVARAVMDFNRFPGNTLPHAKPMDRLALNQPFSDALEHPERSAILANYYDPISEGMEQHINGKLIKLSVHTYDEHNLSLTQRPEVSVLTRSLSYQRRSRMPFGLFDPLFPDRLAESCSTRVLRDRVALTLEKRGFYLEHNYPYCLPDGSLEIRSQAWFFFNHIKRAFDAEYPGLSDSKGYTLAWHLLFNTNLRSTEAEAFFGYLHRFRRPPPHDEQRFLEAQHAYAKIKGFLEARSETLVDAYRVSKDRPSSIAVEVRKDLLFRFENGVPVEPVPEVGEAIADRVAEGIGTYLTSDRPALG